MKIIETGKYEFWVEGEINEVLAELRRRGASSAMLTGQASLQVSIEEALRILGDETGVSRGELALRKFSEGLSRLHKENNGNELAAGEDSGVWIGRVVWR